MTYDEFMHQLENLNEDTDAIDIYTSPDFQCDQTTALRRLRHQGLS